MRPAQTPLFSEAAPPGPTFLLVIISHGVSALVTLRACKYVTLPGWLRGRDAVKDD